MIDFKEIQNGLLFPLLCIIQQKEEEEIFISSYHWFENLVMMVKWNCRLCVDEDLKFIQSMCCYRWDYEYNTSTRND
jgi:hypothetical protein